MNTISSDVIVVGSGLTGAPLAMALATHGVTVTVMDRPGGPQTRTGRASVIAPSSLALLDAIGLWPELEPVTSPIHGIRVTDRTSPLFMHWDSDDAEDEDLGCVVEDHLLQEILRHRLSQDEEHVTLAPAPLVTLTISGDGVTARLDDGTVVTAQLAVAADGPRSPEREAAGIGLNQWKHGQSAILCTLAHERDHGGVVQARFLPSGPCLLLPLPERRSTLVWTMEERLANAVAPLDERLFLSELKRQVGDFLGDITVEGERSVLSTTRYLARAYGVPRLALVGDALRRMHPAQGRDTAMGLTDVAVLTDVIVEARRLGLDVGSRMVLEGYARRRRAEDMMALGTTGAVTRLFANETRPVSCARGLGLAAVNFVPRAKGFLVRHVMGLSCDIPLLFKEDRDLAEEISSLTDRDFDPWP